MAPSVEVADDRLERHRAQMATVHPVYDLFAQIEGCDAGSDAAPDERAEIEAEARGVVECVIEREFRWTPEAREGTARLVALAAPHRVQAAKALHESISGPYAARKGAELVLARLGSWLELARGKSMGPFLDLLPRLNRSLPELGASGGVETILQLARGLRDKDAIASMLKTAGSYGSTDGPTVLEAARVAHATLERNKPETLERITAAVPPGKVLLERDGARVWVALAKLNASCAKLNADARESAIHLCAALAETDLSSAYAGTTTAAQVALKLQPNVAEAYVKDFRALADAVGTRVVGYCTRTLPGLYGTRGLEPTRVLVRDACAAARKYGPTAGEWFYSGKTSAASS